MMTTVLAATLAAGQPRSAVRIVGGTPAQQEMARWALERFEAADLSLPPIEIRFHRDRSGCQGRSGYYLAGVADVCGTHTDGMARRLILHEMGHGWAEAALSAEEQRGFLRLRGLTTWNDKGAKWEERGFEHAAEVISWALGGQGRGIETPSIPGHSVLDLAEAYRMLTGNPLPQPSGWFRS